jgi:CBS domain-containing protein
MKAREIMTANPETVMRTDTVETAARVMRDADVGIVPVVDDGEHRRLRGVITDRDIAVRCIAEGRTGDCRVSDLMSNDLVTARPDDDVHQVMNRMKAEQVRRIPIVDDNNCLVGIVAQADLALDGASDRAVGDGVERISKPARTD